MIVPVVFKGELEVEIDALPEGTLEPIKGALTLPNVDKQTRAREKIPGWWDMPDTIALWRIDERRGGDRLLVMPRGFAIKLRQGLEKMGHTIEWVDRRTEVPAQPGYFTPFLMRGYQAEAATAMISAEQGVFECPAGGGKTVNMLGTIALLDQRSLVIVDKADLMEQWREEAYDFMGLPAIGDDDFDEETGRQVRGGGKIGQDVWEEQDFTVCLRQTLWSRLDHMIATGWFANLGCVVVDEVHHAAADTLSQILNATATRYFFGPSATPATTPVKGKQVEAYVGPIIHRISRERLRDEGVLMLPHVVRLKTGFDTPFWPTHDSDTDGNCEMPGCKKKGKHGHKNNYQTAQSKLVKDEERNAFIARQICSEPDRIHLVPSRQLNHLDLLKKAVVAEGWEGGLYFLRGEENARGESREIVRQIRTSETGAVVFSTTAAEGLNIPPLDREHIVFPLRQHAAMIQLAGRVERVWPGKVDPIIYDYRDVIDVFSDQGKERDHAYSFSGYPVEDQ